MLVNFKALKIPSSLCDDISTSMTSPTNLSSTVVHFCKIILRPNLAHGILNLPKMFTRKHGDGMSNPVFLRSPDGTEWKIYWVRSDGEIWFQNGWKEFATYYSLDHGHLLFFEYQGTTHFQVHIFDNSALEIDYPSHTTHCRKENLVHISDDSNELLLEQLSCQNTRVKPTLSSPQPCKKMKNSITTNVVRSPNLVHLHQHVQTKSPSIQEEKSIKQKLHEVEGKHAFNSECSKVEQLTSTALKKAITFRPEHPFFLLVMKESLIKRYYLKIPPHFVEKYLKNTREVVNLEVLDGRTWPVIYSAPRISGGWKKFASENNLNVGDVCVFEMIKRIQGLAFIVSIFRGAEEPSFPISQVKDFQLESDFKSKILTRAHKEASKFKSENPFFMVTLPSKENTTRYLCVPIYFARKYLIKFNQNVMMIQFRNKLWPVKFVCNSSSSAKFSAGWALFARENNLKPGDICVFELVNRKDATLVVHVFRSHGN
ncbi:B3 domain-containing transcription factor VRN1-like [Phaseolus vulgaris]